MYVENRGSKYGPMVKTEGQNMDLWAKQGVKIGHPGAKQGVKIGHPLGQKVGSNSGTYLYAFPESAHPRLLSWKMLRFFVDTHIVLPHSSTSYHSLTHSLT